ncbi:hypothetical protein N7461_003361 [Penicillium sp. DV-2018c]|nr:hypothetical protein N7461_003361 [Penicillium sp. DV-2018c]
MTEIQISDDQLTSLKDKVIFITGTYIHITSHSHIHPTKKPPHNPNSTGGASGIGKATATLCLTHGAHTIIGDINLPSSTLQASTETPNLKEIQVDITSWPSQVNAFTQILTHYGRIDHVFANAGIGPTTSFLEETLDSSGNLTPPDFSTLNVNLLGVLSTVRLAAYYIQKYSTHRSENELGSIVVTGSASSFQDFSAGDYTVAKHGVLGIIRGLGGKMEGKVRINAVAPSWTDTGMVPREFIEGLGVGVQSPSVVARSVGLLFCDGGRHGEVLYSAEGRFREINKGAGGLLEAAKVAIGVVPEEGVMRRISEAKGRGEI